MKIAVMGTGGVGGYFGGLLARAGNEVTFVARGPHLKAIQEKGLRVESLNDGDFTVTGTALEDTTQAGIQELILFTVKMYSNTEAIKAVAPMLGPDSIVLTLQNGIDNGDQLVEAFGPERVMIGSTYLEGRIKEPGVVTQGGPGSATFGEREPGITERGQRLLQVFQEANWRVQLAENMPDMLWKKFGYLAATAALCTTCNATIGEIRSTPETRALVEAAVLETMAVGRALGVPIQEDTLEWSLNAMDNFPAQGQASMAKDFNEGKPVELEGLTGTVVRLGRRAGVPTPVNDTFYAIMKPWAKRLGMY
ncbi:MAG: ketopantoate reductase family protein [Dehalococcoidia bacterium]